MSIMDTTTDKLLAQAAAFSDREGLSLAQLSEAVFGHKAFFRRIQTGKGCHMASYERVQRHFIENGHDPAALERDGRGVAA
jgi:hypothetical protein